MQLAGDNVDMRLKSAINSMQSTSSISSAERENRIENATQVLESYGIDLRHAVTDTDLIDTLVTGILTLNLKAQMASSFFESDLEEIDLATDDAELNEHYSTLRKEFADKILAFKPIEVLGRFGYSGYWEQLSRVDRVVRSAYLLDYASQHNIHPSPLWSLVYGTNGNKVSLNEKESDN